MNAARLFAIERFRVAQIKAGEIGVDRNRPHQLAYQPANLHQLVRD